MIDGVTDSGVEKATADAEKLLTGRERQLAALARSRKPWKPGHSGNPFGPQKKVKDKHGVTETAQGFGLDAVKTLHRIMLDDTQRASDRINAAKEILCRGFGRPSQQVTVSGSVGTSAVNVFVQAAREIGLERSGNIVTLDNENIATPLPAHETALITKQDQGLTEE